jgi:hypothetical protein
MYESFFQLHDRPFTTAPRVDRYFPAASIEHARQTLLGIAAGITPGRDSFHSG